MNLGEGFTTESKGHQFHTERAAYSSPAIIIFIYRALFKIKVAKGFTKAAK